MVLRYGLIIAINALHQGLSEPEFYGDLVYKFKKKMYIGLIFLISSEKLSYVTNVLDIT